MRKIILLAYLAFACGGGPRTTPVTPAPNLPEDDGTEVLPVDASLPAKARATRWLVSRPGAGAKVGEILESAGIARVPEGNRLALAEGFRVDCSAALALALGQTLAFPILVTETQKLCEGDGGHLPVLFEGLERASPSLGFPVVVAGEVTGSTSSPTPPSTATASVKLKDTDLPPRRPVILFYDGYLDLKDRGVKLLKEACQLAPEYRHSESDVLELCEPWIVALERPSSETKDTVDLKITLRADIRTITNKVARARILGSSAFGLDFSKTANEVIDAIKKSEPDRWPDRTHPNNEPFVIVALTPNRWFDTGPGSVRDPIVWMVLDTGFDGDLGQELEQHGRRIEVLNDGRLSPGGPTEPNIRKAITTWVRVKEGVLRHQRLISISPAAASPSGTAIREIEVSGADLDGIGLQYKSEVVIKVQAALYAAERSLRDGDPKSGCPKAIRELHELYEKVIRPDPFLETSRLKITIFDTLHARTSSPEALCSGPQRKQTLESVSKQVNGISPGCGKDGWMDAVRCRF